MIECLCFRLKAETLVLAKNPLERYKFTPGDISMLEEQTYDVDGKGKVRKRKIFLKTANNLRFAFNVSAKLTLDFNLDASGKGWESYKKAVKIRNRITHPKNISDLNISKEEMSTVREAFMWFIDTFDEYYLSRVKYSEWMAKNLEKLKKKIETL